MLLGAGGGDALPFPLLMCCGVAYALKFELYNHDSHFLTVLTLARHTLPCLPSALPAPSLCCGLSSSRCKHLAVSGLEHSAWQDSHINQSRQECPGSLQAKEVSARSWGVWQPVLDTTGISSPPAFYTKWSAIRGTGLPNADAVPPCMAKGRMGALEGVRDPLRYPGSIAGAARSAARIWIRQLQLLGSKTPKRDLLIVLT